MSKVLLGVDRIVFKTVIDFIIIIIIIISGVGGGGVGGCEKGIFTFDSHFSE